MPLTHAAILNAKPKDAPYKMMDTKGLFLYVHPNGGKYWRLWYYFAGKEKTLALGTYPTTTLAEARDLQIEAKKLLQAGKDPSEEKKAAKREAILNAENSFKVVAQEWHKANLAKWTPAHAANTWRRLEANAIPCLGKRPIKDIKPADLLAMVRKVEARGATDKLLTMTMSKKSYVCQVAAMVLCTLCGKSARVVTVPRACGLNPAIAATNWSTEALSSFWPFDRSNSSIFWASFTNQFCKVMASEVSRTCTERS